MLCPNSCKTLVTFHGFCLTSVCHYVLFVLLFISSNGLIRYRRFYKVGRICNIGRVSIQRAYKM